MQKDISWMKGSFGLSSHYTQTVVKYRSNDTKTYQQAIEELDEEKIANTLAELGCTHYIFTLTHGTQYLPMPCATLDRILPGRTCKRDFISDLIKALKNKGIRLILYYNHSCNEGVDPEWEDACGYSKGGKENLDKFASNICDIVREISLRYGKDIFGWWFDSAYSVDPRGKYNTITTDMGDWLFPWDKLVEAVESGNPNSAVTINSGIDEHYRYYENMDYWAGEMEKLDYNPYCDKDDLQQTRWLPIEGNYAWVLGSYIWVLEKRLMDFLPSAYAKEDVKKYLDVQLNAGNMVTFNVLTDIDGTINPLIVEFLKDIKKQSV